MAPILMVLNKNYLKRKLDDSRIKDDLSQRYIMWKFNQLLLQGWVVLSTPWSK